jgi:thiamine-phosphate pyrophosphorylase
VAYASEAAEAGIDLLQVREPDLDDVTLLRLVEQICDATRGSSTRVLVNDRVDIALAAGAAGVHLRGSSYPAARARTLLGDAAIVGRSVHEASEAAAVDAAGGLDYLIFGTVFATRSKPEGHRLAGLEGLAAAVRACRRPVLAIGGVREEHIHQIAQTGAAGVAAIALFSGAASARSGASASTGGTARPLRLLAQRLRLTYNP